MGAARVLESVTWTQVGTGVAARKPSWLSPAMPKAPESTRRPSLSIVPPLPDDAETKAAEEAKAQLDALATEIAQRDEAIREMGEELQALRGTAAQLATELATVRRRILEASEGELVTLAMAIAKRVVGASMITDPSQIVAWAHDAIATLPARESMVVAISSDLGACVAEGAWAQATSGGHRLEVDASLPAATVEVRCGAATVEVSAEARLAAVGEAIGVSS